MFLTTRRTVTAGLLVAVLAAGARSAPVPQGALKAEKELAAVAAKLNGTWVGGPCEGTYIFRPNGTYDFVFVGGPGPMSHGGVWSLHGDPAKPTLALQCRTGARREKMIVLTALRVEDKEFEFAAPDKGTRIFSRAEADNAMPASAVRNDK